MLIVSQSSTTNVGMRSYLNHIFSKYIHLETCLAADVDTERMEKADLVLFSSRSAARIAEPLMTPKIRYLICIRTFNHTYLNRILSIRPIRRCIWSMIRSARQRTAYSFCTHWGSPSTVSFPIIRAARRRIPGSSMR